MGGLANPDYAVPDRPGVDAVGVHINLFVLAYVVYCTMYTAVPPFWSTDIENKSSLDRQPASFNGIGTGPPQW